MKKDDPILPLIPYPALVRFGSGKFALSAEFDLTSPPGIPGVDFFKEQLVLLRPNSRFTSSKSQQNITRIILRIYKDISPKEEAYKLLIDNGKIFITSPSDKGLFAGCITLLQLLSHFKHTMPNLEIIDYPRFEWRGLHLDVSRHFFKVEFIKKYLDLMALHKLNRFHWHLTDDNGWRLEIKKYPGLTEISSWREDLEDYPWRERDLHQGKSKRKYGGFYSQEDVREIVCHAAERNIEIIPEIEMPGHSREVFAAYPQFSCTGKKLTVAPGGYWPNCDIFCAGKEETFHFLQNILAEVIELFPSPWIHLGGDEVDRSRWHECEDCQLRINTEHLKDEVQLQSYFLRQIGNFLKENDKQYLGWDEIFESTIPSETIIMCWQNDGISAAEQAVSRGNRVILCPNRKLYFDWHQTDAANEPGAFGVTTLEQVYDYNPETVNMTASQKKLILGIQANLWTEFIATPKQAEYMAYPRTCALAEAAWSEPAVKDYSSFLHRLQYHKKLLAEMQVNFHK
ncbi:MAG: beta-N-acetylhexosaminidase [Candidatus Cloacimonetes bacterium]|nr:beta-N-acetylhexosaminidase [Candidatus Cloacimonadota bacterium]